VKEDPIDPDELETLIAAQVAGPPLGTRPGEAAPAGPVNWRTLAPGEAARVWEALREWVEWFTVRYDIPLTTVPACWYRHGQLVEELSALHTLHQVSFDPADTGYGPIGFHERLTPALTRLARAGSGCATSHIDLKPRTWPSRPGADWDAWITQTHAPGDTPVPPDEERKK